MHISFPNTYFSFLNSDIVIDHQQYLTLHYFCLKRKGNVQKPQSRLCAVMGGGVPPLAVIFFPLTFWPVACRDGGGYPPLPWLKNLLKIGPKTVFFRQKTPFSAKKIQAACRDGGGGTPLCRDFFSVNFLAGRLPWWGEGRGGGNPHHGKKPWLGFLNPSLNVSPSVRESHGSLKVRI